MDNLFDSLSYLLRTRQDRLICFKGKSDLYLSRRLTNKKARQSEIVRITDDLLNVEHECTSKKRALSIISDYSWIDIWSVKSKNTTLLMDSLEYPEYFIDKLLLRVREEIIKEVGWRRTDWYKVLQLLLHQKNFSAKTLLEQAIWLTRTIPMEEESNWSINTDPTVADLIHDVIYHENFDPRNLIILCSDPNPLTRQLASLHPSCPLEGKAALALMEMGSGVLDE